MWSGVEVFVRGGRFVKRERGSSTLEYPWGFVHENYPQTFGIVRFKAFDHEFDRTVVL